MLASVLRLFDDRKPVLPAESVGHITHLPVVLLSSVKLNSIIHRHSIDDEMVVHVTLLIKVGTDKHLISFGTP